MIEIIKGTKIDFMGKRVIALTFSTVLLIIGLITIIQVARGTANLGIDFAGGTSVQIKFNQTIPLHEIRQALIDGDVADFDLQDLPTENKVLIRIKKGEQTLGNLSKKIISVLSMKFSESSLVVDSTTEIGPKVGARLRQDAMWAILAAIIGILIYITFRFQFRFSVGATVATVHDVLAVLGIFYLTGREINLILVSALLMIAGYSLTDSVVVFDRIRENMRIMHKETPYKVINKSINEVLSRTIVTSLTTGFPALALFVFGGEVIHDFALAIMLGIAVGTYSSIFVASPIVLLLKGKRQFAKK
ncbi:MAG: protein translocase subunit SecF [Thermodesulfovibrionia bacterium]|nr:protein translocase subunit SecF [Thermodesulfovibrionia bacterium]